MKEFWSRYSYKAVKIFVAQLAISLFGLTLAIVTGKNESLSWLQILTSVLSVGFLLFIIYGDVWKTGTEDRPSVVAGRRKENPMTGVYIGLLANAPNFLLSLIFLIGTIFPDTVMQQIGGVAASIHLFVHGEYTGILAVKIADAPLNTMPWAHFAITIPSIVTCFVAYLMGVREKHLTNLFIPVSPEEKEKKEEQKKKRRGEGDD